MSKAFLTSTALLLALGIGSAQAASTTSSTQDQATSASSSTQAGNQQSGTMNMRQQLHDALTKQGYTNINIMPSSFMVHAKDKSGNPVAMVIGPDSVTAVTELTSGKQADAGNTQNKTTTQQ